MSKEPDQDQDFQDLFDRIAVRLHTEYPGNSPLDQNRTRTNYDLTMLVSDYIGNRQEHEEIPNQAYDAYRVLSDFVLAISTLEPGQEF